MAVAIMRKAFEDRDKSGPGLPSYMPTLDKFLLKVFNRLSHNYKVSRSLLAGSLLDLLNYYTFNTLVKSINLSILKTKFLLLIFRLNFNITDDITFVNGGKV